MSANGTAPFVTHMIREQTISAQVVQHGPGQGVSTSVPVQVNEAGSSYTSSILKKFLKGEPKALGTVQIMIGVFVFMFSFAISQHTLTFCTGTVFWAPLIYLIAGSLSVAAEKLNPCLVKGSLGMNVVSAVAAGFAIIMLIVDLGTLDFCYWILNIYSTHRIPNCTSGLVLFVVLLILTVLEFCISISISAFGCNVICCIQPRVFVVNNPNVTALPTENPSQIYSNHAVVLHNKAI